MRIAVVQINVGMDKAANLAAIATHVESLARSGADLAVLPEMCMCLTGNPAALQAAAEELEGNFTNEIRALAKRYSINVHVGSFAERRGSRYFNTGVLIRRDGSIAGQYSKIHRFDVELPDGTVIRESAVFERGADVVVLELEGVRIGLSICYDIRFGELYRRLAAHKAEVIVLPAAFMFQTGAVHWEVLLRARAIETQCYIAAAGQIGSFDGKYHNFGHSMIVDPWGQIIAQVSNVQGTAQASFDRKYLELVRARIPMHQHHVLT
jgi:predicted amidohydrolase